MALCTRADVEAVLGGVDLTSADARITILIALAQGLIEGPSGADRPIEQSAHTVSRSGGRRIIHLENTPIATITSLTEDGTALVEDTDFIVDPDSGIVYRTTGGHRRRWEIGVRNITVTYTGGYDPVPDDLRWMCARAVAQAHQSGAAFASIESGEEGVKRVRLEGSDEIEYTDTAASLSASVTLDEADLEVARSYRPPVLA